MVWALPRATGVLAINIHNQKTLQMLRMPQSWLFLAPYHVLRLH